MRGKYASSAEARRAREDAITTASAAERRVSELTQENTELRQDINGLLGAHNSEMVRMRIALAKSETPALRARDEIISKLRADLADVKAKLDGTKRVHEKFVDNAFDHFKAEHQMTNVDVLQEVLLKWAGGDQSGYFYDGPLAKQKGGFDVEAAERIDIARGIRSKRSVIRDAQHPARQQISGETFRDELALS